MEQHAIPKHFRDLFVDKRTNRLSPYFLFRNNTRGWKGIMRKPLRVAIKQHPSLGIEGMIMLFAPHKVRIGFSLTKGDHQDWHMGVYEWLESNTTQPWFILPDGSLAYRVYFVSVSDAVMCRLSLEII